MTEQALAITIGDTQTLYAAPGPQDQDQLTELFGNGPTIQLREVEGDVEGHALSNEVLVDVEGHAIALRLPTPADAQALKRALAVGAVTATLVGAGVIASLQSPVQPSTTVIDTTRSYSQGAPAQMLRADERQTMREQSFADARHAAAEAERAAEIPSGQVRADVAEQLRQQSRANTQVSSEATTPNADIEIPAPAQRADEAQTLSDKSFADKDE